MSYAAKLVVQHDQPDGARWRLTEWGLAPRRGGARRGSKEPSELRGFFIFAFLGSNAGCVTAEGGSDGRCFCAPVLLEKRLYDSIKSACSCICGTGSRVTQ